MPSLNGECASEQANDRTNERMRVCVWERKRATNNNNNNITSFGVSVFCLFVCLSFLHFTLMKHTHSHTRTQQARGTVALERFVVANLHGIVVLCVCIDYLFSLLFFSFLYPRSLFSSLLWLIQVGCDARTLALFLFVVVWCVCVCVYIHFSHLSL